MRESATRIRDSGRDRKDSVTDRLGQFPGHAVPCSLIHSRRASSIGGKIHFSIGFAVQNIRLFVVEIEEVLLFALIFEESLIRANDLGVILKSLAHTRPQADQFLNTICGQE